ncbi:MAG: alpha/beta hydrolase [Gallicola sp.]|nr:alpha/beta hydrolase [Gallicola sp.]
MKDKILIQYNDFGKGDVLVFLHGLGADKDMFDPQIEHFRNKYRIIISDQRGNGQSQTLDVEVGRVLDIQSDDLFLLLNSLKIKNCVLIGVSYGGVLAYHFLLKYPEKVSGLVVCDSFSDTIAETLLEKANMKFIKLSLPLYHAKKFLTFSLKLAYRKWPQASEYFNRKFVNLRSKEVILQRKALNEADYTKRLHEINIPVLGIVGDRAHILIKLMKRSFKEIKNSRLVILKDSIDPSNLCQPEEFNLLVEDFLKEING